jgi:hypothetical protein
MRLRGLERNLRGGNSDSKLSDGVRIGEAWLLDLLGGRKGDITVRMTWSACLNALI